MKITKKKIDSMIRALNESADEMINKSTIEDYRKIAITTVERYLKRFFILGIPLHKKFDQNFWYVKLEDLKTILIPLSLENTLDNINSTLDIIIKMRKSVKKKDLIEKVNSDIRELNMTEKLENVDGVFFF